jgi:predicted O-methyltransferase YrrM
MLMSRNKRVRQVAALLQTGNLLFFKLLFKNPSRARMYPAEVFRAYLGLAGGDRWRCTAIFDVLPPVQGPLRIQLEHLPDPTILTPLEQLACLALIARALRPRAIFEIGTFRGRTALNFALNAPESCTVFTLDLPPEDKASAMGGAGLADRKIISAAEPGSAYRGAPEQAKIEQLFGDSQSFDFSPWHGKIDLVYVDGAHHYDAVRSDTENALKMVRPGGYVLWDEFGNFGDYNDVTRAVIDRLGADSIVQVENTQLGVYRKAVDDRSSGALVGEMQ